MATKTKPETAPPEPAPEAPPEYKSIQHAMLAAQRDVTKDAQAAVTFCTVKAKDQRRAMEMLDEDPGLRTLQRIEAPLFDMEIRGVPALQFMGGQVWTE